MKQHKQIYGKVLERLNSGKIIILQSYPLKLKTIQTGLEVTRENMLTAFGVEKCKKYHELGFVKITKNDRVDWTHLIVKLFEYNMSGSPQTKLRLSLGNINNQQ